MMTELSIERQHKIKENLLLASHFREIVSSFYITASMVRLRHLLYPEMPPNTVITVQHRLIEGKLFQNSLIDPTLMPPETRSTLYRLIYWAVKDQSTISLYQILEEDREGEEAPLSLKHVYNILCRSENISMINELVGNAENNLATVKAMIDRLWNEYGRTAREVFRNAMVHGRANIWNPNSETYKKLIGNEEASIAFYRTIEGIYDILLYISTTCFGEENLPTEEQYWDHIMENEEHSIWCFDHKYKSLLDGQPKPNLTLPSDWPEKHKKEK